MNDKEDEIRNNVDHGDDDVHDSIISTLSTREPKRVPCRLDRVAAKEKKRGDDECVKNDKCDGSIYNSSKP